MQSYQQDAIRIYLTVARHLVLQGVRCDFERRFVVVHPEDIRIRDPLGACLAMKTVLHEPKLYGYTGGLSDPFLAKLLQEAGVDLNNPLVSRALHQLVSIHDKFSSLRWSIVLKERFEVVPWSGVLPRHRRLCSRGQGRACRFEPRSAGAFQGRT